MLISPEGGSWTLAYRNMKNDLYGKGNCAYKDKEMNWKSELSFSLRIKSGQFWSLSYSWPAA